MKITVQPPLSHWSLSPAGTSRNELAAIVNANADRLGTGRITGTRPIVATGHQEYLWHPGILAKDIAVDAAAERLEADRLHVVVDQDVHDVVTLDVARVAGERIVVDRVRLGDQDADLPTGSHDPVTLMAEHPNLPESLPTAFDDLPPCRSLAEQLTVVVSRLRQPIVSEMPVVFASQLARLPAFGALVDRMLADPRRCAAAYNRAVQTYPEAGIAPLQLDREMVELPLWRLQRGWPRQRVFADTADSNAILVGPDGAPLSREHDAFAPRALMLTALMRSTGCDWFVHGLGGGEYDRVMEQWWQAWPPDVGTPLAPMSVVTADLFMSFDAPVADRRDLAQALWRVHHLPHNLDRELGLDGDDIARKRRLLATMDLDRDRKRRAAAFEDLHRINRMLAAAYPHALDDARRQLERTRSGLANWHTACRRDWCFALYPPEQLHALADAIRQAATIEA